MKEVKGEEEGRGQGTTLQNLPWPFSMTLGAELRGPAATPFTSRDACSNSITKLFRVFYMGLAWPPLQSLAVNFFLC